MKKRFMVGLSVLLLTLVIAVALLTLVIVGCQKLLGAEPESPTGGPIKYSREYWGEWLRMDTGETWYITSNNIKTTQSGSQYTNELQQSVSLNKQSDRVVEVSDGGRKYYLFASRTANASFTGKIAGFEQSSRSGIARGISSQSIGGIQGIAENAKNSADKKPFTTDAGGGYDVEDVILGDSYIVTPEGGTPTTVTPIGDGDDVGTITITKGVNFKTSIVSSSRQIYAGTDYSFDIVIKNTGDEDCTAATWQINFGTGIQGTGEGLTAPGTIEPGRTKTRRITIRGRLDSADTAYEFKKINVTITDTIQQKTWEDSVSVRFIRGVEMIPLYIAASSKVSGVVIPPKSAAIHFDSAAIPFSGTSASLTVPWSDEDYLVVFSGATADTETFYSFGFKTAAFTDFTGFTELGNYEPNNTEAAATAITDSRIMSYLHKNDIDYYRINFTSMDFTSTGGTSSREVRSRTEFMDVLSVIRDDPRPGVSYTIYITSSFSLDPVSLTDTGYTNKTITIRSKGSTIQEISLNNNGSLFTVGSASVVPTLILQDITIRGRISVEKGRLDLRSGGEISGDVSVGRNSTFSMSGGEISGSVSVNDVSVSHREGVYAGDFSMSGGEISGGGVSVNGGSFGMSGGKISGGGVSVNRGSFLMGGGEISGSSGFGVSVSSSDGTFIKRPSNRGTSGIIYGSEASGTLKNTAGAVNFGSNTGTLRRMTTAGETVSLSTRSSDNWD